MKMICKPIVPFRFLKPGNDAAGWITTIIIGIVGSVLGGFLGRIFFGADVTNDVFSFYSFRACADNANNTFHNWDPININQHNPQKNLDTQPIFF